MHVRGPSNQEYAYNGELEQGREPFLRRRDDIMWEFFKTEPGIRLLSFQGVFLAMALWELLAPRRRLSVGKPLRWASNLGLVVINTVLLRLIVPLGAFGIALIAEGRGWGLFHNLALPAWLAIAGSIILLDLAIYLQHLVFHAVPLFWRLHMVHHADLDIDVTTGLRFHTLEILLSLGIKAVVIMLLGPPALAVLIFEPDPRHSRHAPCASFHSHARDQQQFRIQSPLVGFFAGHVPAPAP
jgi:sterol desaturase/sphingolipid hydroxylase (fatty acid hydroxylase superfamily)